MTGDNKNGFTLIELLVSFGIFVTVVGVSVGMFLMSLRAHRSILAEKAVSENINFALEFMSRHMRVAQRYDSAIHPTCDPPGPENFSDGQTYITDGLVNEVYFINYNSDCIRFSWEDRNGDSISDSIIYQNVSDSGNPLALTDILTVNVEKFDMYIIGSEDTDADQPRVTIVIEASGVGPTEQEQNAYLSTQTTVVARGLDTP